MNGTNYTFPSSEQMRVSLLVNQLRVNFTKGERVNLRALAVNSVGTSDPTSVAVIVPCELCEHTWNILVLTVVSMPYIIVCSIPM